MKVPVSDGVHSVFWASWSDGSGSLVLRLAKRCSCSTGKPLRPITEGGRGGGGPDHSDSQSMGKRCPGSSNPHLHLQRKEARRACELQGPGRAVALPYIQDTEGAAFHPELELPEGVVKITRGISSARTV